MKVIIKFGDLYTKSRGFFSPMHSQTWLNILDTFQRTNNIKLVNVITHRIIMISEDYEYKTSGIYLAPDISAFNDCTLLASFIDLLEFHNIPYSRLKI